MRGSSPAFLEAEFRVAARRRSSLGLNRPITDKSRQVPNTKSIRSAAGKAFEAPRARTLPRSLKRSELIAREIVRDVAERNLQPGTPLPHETSMMADYGVGRASIREALRILEAQGLITLRPGRNGGPVLARTGPEQLGQTLTLFLRMSGFTYGDLARFMKTVSPQLAGLAAMNKDRDQLRDALGDSTLNPCTMVNLPPAVDRPEQGPHSMINKLSGDRLLSMFADAVDAVFTGHTWAVTQGEDFIDIARRDHVAIAEAVLSGKPTKARAAMAEHIDNIFAYCERKVPDLFDQPVEWK